MLDNTYLTSFCQDAQATNKRTFMRLLAIITILIALSISGVSHGAEFISFEKPNITREERMILRQVEKRRADNKIYVFNTMADQLDRIEIPRKPVDKSGEKYNGR